MKFVRMCTCLKVLALEEGSLNKNVGYVYSFLSWLVLVLESYFDN